MNKEKILGIRINYPLDQRFRFVIKKKKEVKIPMAKILVLRCTQEGRGICDCEAPNVETVKGIVKKVLGDAAVVEYSNNLILVLFNS